MKALLLTCLGGALDVATLFLMVIAAAPMWVAGRTHRWAQAAYREAQS